MGQTTDLLTSAIDRWHLDATTGAKDPAVLRSTMLALAAHIDGSHTQLGAAHRLRLQGKLESAAPVAAVDGAQGEASGSHVSASGQAEADPEDKHISIFA